MNKLFLLTLIIVSFNALAQKDSALSFNGSTDYLEFGTDRTAPGFSSEFSVECWVKFDTINSFQPIFQYGTCNSYRHSMNIQLASDNTVSASINDDNSCTRSFLERTSDAL